MYRCLLRLHIKSKTSKIISTYYLLDTNFLFVLSLYYFKSRKLQARLTCFSAISVTIYLCIPSVPYPVSIFNLNFTSVLFPHKLFKKIGTCHLSPVTNH